MTRAFTHISVLYLFSHCFFNICHANLITAIADTDCRDPAFTGAGKEIIHLRLAGREVKASHSVDPAMLIHTSTFNRQTKGWFIVLQQFFGTNPAGFLINRHTNYRNRRNHFKSQFIRKRC